MTTNTTTPAGGNMAELVFSWIWVGIPIAWGVWVTIGNAAKLFAK